MPLVTYSLAELLLKCPADKGMDTHGLHYHLKETLSFSAIEEFTLELSDKNEMHFTVHTDNGKTVITSLSPLSTDCIGGISFEFLPEIIEKLSQRQEFTALQFPHAFTVSGWLTKTTYRMHFNHLLFYKDSANDLTACLIESTSNPIGLHSLFGWGATSIISGKELLQNKLIRLMSKDEVNESLKKSFALPDNSALLVNNKPSFVKDPVVTSKQASRGDRRCSIYVLNAMVTLINYFASNVNIKEEEIIQTVSDAHNELNTPEMRAISFPDSGKGFLGLI